MICSPDIVREKNKGCAILPTGLIIGQRRLEPALILINTPDPASGRCIELRSSCAPVVESNICIPMVGDLVEGIGNSIDEPRRPMYRLAFGNAQIHCSG